MLNKSEEDYIKFIYEKANNESSPINIKDIAAYFSYTEQSVHEMVKKLQKKNFLNYQPYKGLTLTKKGTLEAIRMIRAHRIWERFLEEYLGYSWDEVHDEAEKLEHASSEALLEKLYDTLGKPSHCQHGNPIPDFDGNVLKLNDMPLASFKTGESCRLNRILDHKPLLTFLSQKKVHLNDQITIEKNDTFQELMHISMNGAPAFPISYKIAQMMFGIK